jgi:hypothetical protein
MTAREEKKLPSCRQVSAIGCLIERISPAVQRHTPVLFHSLYFRRQRIVSRQSIDLGTKKLDKNRRMN